MLVHDSGESVIAHFDGWSVDSRRPPNAYSFGVLMDRLGCTLKKPCKPVASCSSHFAPTQRHGDGILSRTLAHAPPWGSIRNRCVTHAECISPIRVLESQITLACALHSPHRCSQSICPVDQGSCSFSSHEREV